MNYILSLPNQPQYITFEGIFPAIREAQRLLAMDVLNLQEQDGILHLSKDSKRIGLICPCGGEIVMFSQAKPQDQFTNSFAYIVRKHVKDTRTPFAVHVFNLNRGGFTLGGYFSDEKEAMQSYESRCELASVKPYIWEGMRG